MSKNSHARVAIVAAAALVGGLVPVLAATSASAAAPTAVNVTPASQVVAVAGTTASANLAVSFPDGEPVAGNVFFRILSGADKTTGTAGTACTTTTATTCAVVNTTGLATTDSVVVFYDVTGAIDGLYQSGDPVSAPVSVTFAGPQVNASISPASAKAAANSSATYAVKGLDVNGVPASGGIPVAITQTLPNGSPAPVLSFVAPTATVFPVVTTGSVTTAGTPGTSTTVYTATTSLPLVSGAANIGVASSVAGTVSITAGAATGSTTAGTASLTVSAGNTTGTSLANDDNARTLTLNTVSSTSFTSHLVTEIVTVTNAAGDALGGVRVVGDVTAGPSVDQAVSTGAVTNQFGQATLTYTSLATAGTDSFKAWVNQTTNPTNTVNAEAGEPQASGTINLVAFPTDAALTGAVDGSALKQLSQPTTTVTYTLTGTPAASLAGLTLDFTIDPTSTPSTKAYTVTPSAVTDANGKATVTVTNPAPAGGDSIKIIATLHGDTLTATSPAITYAASAAATPTLSPAVQTVARGATITHSVRQVDQFLNPVAGQAVTWSIAGRNGPADNPNSTGTGTTNSNGVFTFSYTDLGPVVTATVTDTVTATVGGAATVSSSTVSFIAGSAATSTLAVSGNVTSGTTANPVAPATLTPVAITATAKDVSGVVLANKSVTFTFTGVGTFTTADGYPVAGKSMTVQANAFGVATAYVRSTNPGTQTVVASSDGVTAASVTVTFTSDYVGVTPERVLDTRTGQGSLSAVSGGVAPAMLAPNTNYVFNLAATNLPLDQKAYAFNVTVTGTTQPGNLRIAPAAETGSVTPETSLINYQPGKTVANFVILPNTNGDTFVVYSAGSGASVVIDAVGYYPGEASITTNVPVRVASTVTGLGGTLGPIAANTSKSFKVGAAGTDKAVAINVTAVSPAGEGNLRVYPGDVTKAPDVSNVNYIAGVDKSAFVIVKPDAAGMINVYSAGSSANVLIDVFATFPTTVDPTMLAVPVRVLNTRTSGNTIADGGILDVQITGADVPADAQSVLVSVTGISKVGSTGDGNLRVFPAGGGTPFASTLNYVSVGTDVANFANVKLGTDGKISLASFGSLIDATVDVVGFVPAG